METITVNGVAIALADQAMPPLADEQSALDFIATGNYDTGSRRVALYKQSLPEAFFKLSTGLAGAVLQKFINYGFKLAIIGDFSHYTSQPLHDFITECNSGKDIFFVADRQQALDRLADAP